MSDDSLKVFMDWVDGYLNFEKTPKKNIFWLDTMNFFCEKLGHPEKSYRCFHVAGSKGKGSVSTMLAGILEASGYKAGIYTSPHIVSFTERIGTVNGAFDDRIYLSAAEELMKTVQSVPLSELPGERQLTWFEIVTLFAMLCFKYAKVDWAVWEVGLGGRLDSTNVVSPECCCIGPIELEHTEFLGDTLEKIAAEKGGIIKENVPVVIGWQQNQSVKDVFRQIALQKKSKVIFCDEVSKTDITDYKSRHFTNEDSVTMSANLSSSVFSRPVCANLKLIGDFQAQNAMVASIAAKTVLPQLSEQTIEKGLSSAVLPGRFEILCGIKKFEQIPEMILDGAHTPNSVRFTLETFEKLYYSDSTQSDGKFSSGAVLLFACAADKDVEDIAAIIKSKVDSKVLSTCILTRPGETKACDFSRMEKAFSNSHVDFYATSDYNKAIEDSMATACKNKVPLLVTGSFYLVAEVKKFLKHL